MTTELFERLVHKMERLRSLSRIKAEHKNALRENGLFSEAENMENELKGEAFIFMEVQRLLSRYAIENRIKDPFAI